MPIDFEIYDRFYDILLDKFITQELDGRIPPGLTRKNKKIWSQEKDGEIIILKIFKGKSTNPALFYKQRTAFRTAFKKKQNAPFNKEVHVIGLKYIGINPSAEIEDFDNLNFVDQFWILWEEFTKSLSKEFRKESQSTPIAPTSKNDQAYSENGYALTGTSNAQVARDVIEKFYSYISNKMAGESWPLLSPIYQSESTWNGNKERFKAGYINVESISKLRFIDSEEILGNQVQWTVLIVAKIHLHIVKELNIIPTLTVKDLTAFCNHLKHMDSKFLSRGLEGFENIEINKLFDPLASEYIWYSLHYDSDRLYDLFGTKRKGRTINRLFEICCGYHEDKMLINNIRPIGQSTTSNKS